MKKTVFIGSVMSSKVALETLIDENVEINLVCSLADEASKNVSDYYPIHEIAENNSIPYLEFRKINNADVIKKIKEINADFIFVIGLSQIVTQEILNLAKEYVIGFHPTPLPKHRGRAAIPWQIILGVRESKVTLFKLDKGMDSGDIICQYPYQIDENDYAMDVCKKVCEAMHKALVKSIPEIYNNTATFIKQGHSRATYLLARKPEDGYIDWSLPGKEIETLIRATSKPYPGAFSFYKNSKVIFWKAKLLDNPTYIGIPGQIAFTGDNDEIAIVTKDALLILSEYETEKKDLKFIVGHKFK